MSSRPRINRTVAVVGAGALAVTLAACSPTSSSAPGTSTSAASAEASGTPSASSAASGGATAQTALIDPATLPVTIPFTDRAVHPVVEAGFGTDATFPMMFDTGAPVNVSADLVKQFGFPAVGKQTANAGGGTVTSEIVAIDTVTLGDLSVAQVLALTPWVDENNALSCITENGLVGASAMTNAVWQIDYQAKTITATASTDGVDHVQGAAAVPFNLDQGTPVVELPVGSGQLQFVVDTGSSFGIVAGPKELQSVGIEVPANAPVVHQRLVGAAGSVDQDVPYVTSPIDIGGKKIDYPVAAQDIIPNLGNIGNAFLSQYVVTFDFPNKTLYLDPISADGTVADPPIAGASIGWDGKNTTVGSVAVGGEADKAGLTVGATVTEVDGTPVSNRDEFCAAMIKPDVKTITTADGTFNAEPVPHFFTTK